MQSLENRPASSTKRPGASLNIDTNYKGKGKARMDSPPHTPTAQASGPSKANITAANKALRLRTSPRETFLEDITPVNVSGKTPELESGRIDRDSHDLSLSPRQVTRDSLVDNMLLSLDQMTFTQDADAFGTSSLTADDARLYSSFADQESYHGYAPRSGRGPGHHYSYSSDYENPDDASRYSDNTSRGRRSNSSSQIASRFDFRINTGSRGPPIPKRAYHSRGGKGSKGSSAASVDLGYGPTTGSSRWGHGLAGRSSSFDFGSDRQAMDPPGSSMGRQLTNNATTIDPYDYDAAPTPTVPGGPRRVRPASPIFIPTQEPIPAEPSKLDRKKSTISSKSVHKAKSLRNTAPKVDFGLHDQSRELPVLPAFSKESAPAPLVGYGKSKDEMPTSPSMTHGTKDRPGFFRRVFGSSRINTPATHDPPRSHGSTTSNDTAERPNSKTQQTGSQLKPAPIAPARDPPPAPKEHTHVLTKKPSSFFRRRKKSVSEPEVPVPAPIASPTVSPIVSPVKLLPEKIKIDSRPEDSPVSSLRQVMNPYLKSPMRSPFEYHPTESSRNDLGGTSENDSRDSRGFSPNYELDKSATVRAVKPGSRGDVKATVSVPTLAATASASALRLQDDPSCMDEQTKDASDNPTSGSRHVVTPESNLSSPKSVPVAYPEANSRPVGSTRTSPAVARDIALVAEYERTNSRKTSAKFDQATSSASANLSELEQPSQTETRATTKGAEMVVLAPEKSPKTNERDQRLRLEPTASEEAIPGSKTSNAALPPQKPSAALNKAAESSETVYQSATSLPLVQVESAEDRASSPQKTGVVEGRGTKNDLQPHLSTIAPTEDDREMAQRIYDGIEESVPRDKVAGWLGEGEPAHARTLLAYMEMYDFANQNILAALRSLCNRLILKAESQQVDRILTSFGRRWCQCNPNHGFKAFDVVHTICYSILLLNTDLHLADIEQKMTRSQFVKNTMPTIRKSVVDAAPDAFAPNRPSILPGKSPAFELDPASNSQQGGTPTVARSSMEVERPSFRNSIMPSARRDSDTQGNSPTPLDYDTSNDDCGPLVKAPFHGNLRTWEVQIEIILKDFYNSIRNERLPLSGSTEKPSLQAPSTSSLNIFTNHMLRRTPSVLSRTPSETPSYARGRAAESVRAGMSKWGTKNRSRSRLYPGSVLGSSRTSLDDQSSLWSPSGNSSTWSKYSFGKTQTSMSVDSLGSSFPSADYQQSIGFANALSQAIIREETLGSAGSDGSMRDDLRIAPLLEDDTLGLAGAPWAKEGIVKHKHHLESLDRKAKDRNWNEVFAVIEKGYMSLFSFSSKSMRKSRGKAAGAVVGGGNWQENAESLGSFLLRQTIASALPPPGYSKTRPHVWALSLPTGAVHLFQVGTPDIVKEFVSTANYWSARLSNHPLTGGISNIEYGWSDAIVNNSLVTAINEATNNPRPSTGGPRPSLQSSIRSSLDQNYSHSIRARLPGDRILISDWTPPTQSMRASNLLEPDQLRTLQAYVSSIEGELQKHNQLRSPMLLAFTPRHPNAQKAMANWEKKSSYLLREIVKFRTYIDSLQGAEATKQRIYAERALANISAPAEAEDEEGDSTLRP